jgi:glycosyl hydrolase family 106( putative alpha-L-rhamnosidase)
VNTPLAKAFIPVVAVRRTHVGFVLLLFLVAGVATTRANDDLDRLRAGFRTPPPNCRILMRWWWFGPAVTKPELERELHAMKDAGIGGVELQLVYPMALDDPQTGFHNTSYLSDEFLDDVRFAAEKARELGLRFDVTLGSGWPFGGPHTPVTRAAGKLRITSTTIPASQNVIAVPAITGGEQLLAAFVNESEHVPVAGQMLKLDTIRDGRLTLPTATTARTVTWFIASRTGMMVKRPAVGAEGFVLDHFDRSAIENHLHAVGDRLLSAFGNNPPYSVFSDSLEVYGSDWTGDLLQEFQKRRGYDLTPLLSALAKDVGEQTADIRHDWGETLTELINERYLSPIREWAQQHATRFRSQSYGIPAVSLSSNSLADLPEGEGDNWQGFAPSRWASSANHLYGRNVTSAETWTWLHSPAFRATPLDMKADADRFFLEGVNQIVGHGWPYSPPGIPEPGWSFYAAGAFNDHNPWWPLMPELATYLQRVSYMLRQGEPTKDVAVLLPTDDAWAQFTPGNDALSEIAERALGNDVIPQILHAGFSFDFIDDQAIAKVGIPYRVLVLPHIERLPVATYELVRRYAQNGGIVVATGRLPSKAPGMILAAKDSPRVRQISQELFQSAGGRGVFVADEPQLSAVLAQHLTPDVSLSPPVNDFGFVHRKLPFAEIYFLANNSNREISGTAKFRTAMRNAEWWDPFTGESSPAGNSNKIELNLEPYESRVLIFSNQGGNAPLAAKNLPFSSTAVDLGTDWTVTFPGLHHSTHMDHLHSWTDDDETRFYSGSAVYEKDFTFSPGAGKEVFLDFGFGTPTEPMDKHSRFLAGLESPVREAAQVYINNQFAGSIWKPPHRVEVTRQLRAGENHLRIVVYNSALNEMAGRALPDYRLLNSRYGERFTPQDVDDIKALPSGLLGPPQLISREAR